MTGAITPSHLPCAASGLLCPVRTLQRAALPIVGRLAGIWREILDVRNAYRDLGEAEHDERYD